MFLLTLLACIDIEHLINDSNLDLSEFIEYETIHEPICENNQGFDSEPYDIWTLWTDEYIQYLTGCAWNLEVKCEDDVIAWFGPDFTLYEARAKLVFVGNVDSPNYDMRSSDNCKIYGSYDIGSIIYDDQFLSEFTVTFW